ncbi:TfoX/Sxy family protein [Pseudomonas sp. Hp2]|uniref:TfoX/Sxy family protein n=1 Tax=Pseudomonas sp. Hp2 TaxID=701189 RepID=UPI00112AA5B9|nr:TfoX/Sxy family protein [Pseudomonas sp. Hp2]
MATDPGFIEYIREQADLPQRLTCRKMFGEYGLYCDGKFVAVAADNSLFLKPTEAGRRLLPSMTEGKPYPGAKAWFVVDEVLDDPDLLRRLILATAAELPVPTPRAGAAGKRRSPGTG